MNDSPRIRCHSGIFYDYENPRPDMIKLEDIAHHLSNTCRFSGACDPYYSVAEHSVLVSRLCKYPEYGLMHDAAEAYLWDIPRPAKSLYGDVYAKLTAKCDLAIATRFGMYSAGFHCNAVKEADDLALKYEGHALMDDWYGSAPSIPDDVLTWPQGLHPTAAKELFLEEAERLGVHQNRPEDCSRESRELLWGGQLYFVA